jgi:S-adenosylmethionine synthetase
MSAMKLITTESVSKGHPDKVADQISDAILDALLEQDPDSKVAVETMVKDNAVILGGEVVTNAKIDYDAVVRNVIEEIGYVMPDHGFYHKNVTILNLIGKQSPEINKAVISDEEIGAGDQGFMVGYATNETPNYMPIGMYLANQLIKVVEDSGYGPDTKSQVTIEEKSTGNRVHTMLISTMHPGANVEEVRENLTKSIIESGFEGVDSETKIVINPAGSWLIGGPVSDCGLTGRKIVVDQYGPYCPIGGGAYSGKDSTKVDRSGAYLARYIAKNIVAAGLANKCKVEIAYMIGVAEPASLNIDTFGHMSSEEEFSLTQRVREIFPMTPKRIINHFGLRRPIFAQTARYGHYGHAHLPWESTDMVERLK